MRFRDLLEEDGYDARDPGMHVQGLGFRLEGLLFFNFMICDLCAFYSRTSLYYLYCREVQISDLGYSSYSMQCTQRSTKVVWEMI